jgi:hypothetical protein
MLSGGCEHRAAAEEPPVPGLARLGGQPYIFARGHLRKERGELESAGDTASADPRHRQAGQRLGREAHTAFARLDHPGDQIEQSRFAGAVRADDGTHLAFGDLHRHSVYGNQPTEPAS